MTRYIGRFNVSMYGGQFQVDDENKIRFLIGIKYKHMTRTNLSIHLKVGKTIVEESYN